MDKQEEKRALRRRIQELEGRLSPAYRAEADRRIADRVLSMAEYREAGTVFCFVGFRSEIDTRPLLSAALAAGRTLCVPLCTDRPGIMELRAVRSLDELRPGSFGIPEPGPDSASVSPDQVDFAILPCAACDHFGHRLGRGGGYYDRFLHAYRSTAVLLCRERLIREEIPLEPHDCPVPWVVTETALYEDGVPARVEA